MIDTETQQQMHGHKYKTMIHMNFNQTPVTKIIKLFQASQGAKWIPNKAQRSMLLINIIDCLHPQGPHNTQYSSVCVCVCGCKFLHNIERSTSGRDTNRLLIKIISVYLSPANVMDWENKSSRLGVIPKYHRSIAKLTQRLPTSLWSNAILNRWSTNRRPKTVRSYNNILSLI